ncbi:MAG: glycosyltransferase family 4 protein [archaeon YNP-WB-062]|nr:glycosyltransferase family 4 protein [Candidatus Culexarchaeum yellowstonense]
MKILHVIQSLSGGGVSNVIVNLVKAFHKLGIENVIVTPKVNNVHPRMLKEIRVAGKIYALRGDVNPFNSIKYVLFTRNQIREIIKREKPDAMIIQPGWLSLYSYFLPLMPIIIIVHGTYLNEIRYMWHHPIRGLERTRYITGILLSQAIELLQLKIAALKNNTVIVAVSNNTKKELITMDINPEKVTSVLNGVDKELFKPMSKEHARALVEEWFGVELGDKVLLHVNPGPRKGTHMLIKAIAQLKKLYGRDFTLLIVGRLGPKTYKEYVEEMIRRLRLEKNVKTLGYMENKRLPIIYNSADLTIVPSYSEGGPLITPESLACGTPVVATNVGGNFDYLKLVHSENFVIEIKQYDFSKGLAFKIFEALMTSRKELNCDAIPKWNDVAKAYLSIFESLLR